MEKYCLKWVYRHPRLYNLLDSVLNFGLSDIARAQLIRSHVTPLLKGKILEVGIGTGKSVPYFKEVSPPESSSGLDDFFGVDISKSMLLLAKRYTNKLCVASAYTLPFKHLTFDIVLFIYTLRTIENLKLALDEALRVGNKAIILEFKPLPKVFEWLGKMLFGSRNINTAEIFRSLNIGYSRRSYINNFDIYRVGW